MTAKCYPFRGKRADTRLQRQIREAERLAGPLTLVQGSCNRGVGASAGTHDGEGAADFSTRGLTEKQKRRRVRALRRVGLWAWIRRAIAGLWSEHIHAVSVGNPDLAPGAKNQVSAARRGLDGLVGGHRDPHAGMGLPVINFRHYNLRHRNKGITVCSGCRDDVPRAA